MEIFYGHLLDDEREVLALENAFDLDIRRLNAKYDAICEATAINLDAAENKVIMESGTDEDLEALFEAANTEGTEKRKGVLESIFETIKKFIATIKSKISSIFTKEKAEALKSEKEVKDNGVLDTVAGKASGIMAEAKALFTKLVHGGKVDDGAISALSEKAKKIGVVAAAGAGATVAGKVFYDKIMKSSKEIDAMDNSADVLQSLYHSAKDGKDDKKLKDILNIVGTTVKNASHAVMTAISGGKKKVEDKVDNIVADSKDKKVKKEAVKTNSKFSSDANRDAKDVFGESTEDNFDKLLENYSNITEGAEEQVEPDGTEAGSLEDLEKAVEIF